MCLFCKKLATLRVFPISYEQFLFTLVQWTVMMENRGDPWNLEPEPWSSSAVSLENVCVWTQISEWEPPPLISRISRISGGALKYSPHQFLQVEVSVLMPNPDFYPQLNRTSFKPEPKHLIWTIKQSLEICPHNSRNTHSGPNTNYGYAHMLWQSLHIQLILRGSCREVEPLPLDVGV